MTPDKFLSSQDNCIPTDCFEVLTQLWNRIQEWPWTDQNISRVKTNISSPNTLTFWHHVGFEYTSVFMVKSLIVTQDYVLYCRLHFDAPIALKLWQNVAFECTSFYIKIFHPQIELCLKRRMEYSLIQ